jgi:hypothetical protein
MKIVLLGVLAGCSLAATAQPFAEKLDGPESAYTDKLLHVLQHWPVKRFANKGPGPLEFKCIATVDQEKYVGMLQRSTIRAPISVVEGVLDDVAHYKDLFPDTVDVHVVPGSRLGNRFVTAWEQRIPVPFVPNVNYELGYVVDKTVPGRTIYRYKLHRGDSLIASDGMVILEASGPDTTQFTEYDFFHGRTVPVPATLVWRESLRSAFLSDIAIKLKAENPDWSYKRIAAEGERLVAPEADRFEQCIADRRHVELGDLL